MAILTSVDFERPVVVGNKVFVAGTIKKVAASGGSNAGIDVTPFMTKIEHVMYISPVTNFRPVNLSIDSGDDMKKHDIVIDAFELNWSNFGNVNTSDFTLQGIDKKGGRDFDFELVSNGNEIAKFLIIGSK